MENNISEEGNLRGDKVFHFAKVFLKNSLDKGLSAVMRIGGCSEFRLADIPEGFIKLAIIKVGHTQDCLRHIADTYDCVLLSIGAAKNYKGKDIFISVPDEYVGRAIGLNGKNINFFSDKLEKNIYIIPQSEQMNIVPKKKFVLKKRSVSYV